MALHHLFKEMLGFLVWGTIAASTPVPYPEECWIQPEVPLPGMPRFEDHPARTVRISQPAPLIVRGNPAAQGYRTMLRRGAVDGPNFAGHYTLVAWGCGAGCIDWAVVDAVSGQVTFDSGIRSVSADHVVDPGVGLEASDGVDRTTLQLRFRRDSNLLIVLGYPDEDTTRDGAGFYVWDGHAFRNVGFVPRKDFCSLKPPPSPPERTHHKGRYINGDLGFAVQVPPDYVAEGAAPHEPDHGFTVSLSVTSRLWINAHTEPTHPTTLDLNTRIPGDGVRPERAELKVWKDEDQFIHRRIRTTGLAYGIPVLYTLQLDTKPSREAQDRPVFETFVRSFSSASVIH